MDVVVENTSKKQWQLTTLMNVESKCDDDEYAPIHSHHYLHNGSGFLVLIVAGLKNLFIFTYEFLLGWCCNPFRITSLFPFIHLGRLSSEILRWPGKWKYGDSSAGRKPSFYFNPSPFFIVCTFIFNSSQINIIADWLKRV